MADLKIMFDALVPENIKNIPLVQTAMDIFIQNIEDNSAIAINIKKMYEFNITALDNNLVINSKAKIKQGFVDIYLESLYNTIVAAQNNQALQDKLSLIGKPNATMNKNVQDIVDPDFFLTNKVFKESVGTLSALNYSHKLGTRLESSNNVNLPTITEVKPFHLLVEGPLSAEMYANLVEPISHPVGFTYDYINVVESVFIDLFNLEKVYIEKKDIEIRGSKGYYTIFTSDNTQAAIDAIQADFLTRINILTGKLFTLAEFQAQVQPNIHLNKVVLDITENNTNGRNVSILFTDGTMIVQNTQSTNGNIYYVNANTWIAQAQGIITEFSSSAINGHYSLFLEYTLTYRVTYGDDLTLKETTDITQLNDATSTPGNITYTDSAGALVPIGTSDHLVMTSTQYVNETLTASGTGNGTTNYVVSSDNMYPTTSDLGYIVANPLANLNVWIPFQSANDERFLTGPQTFTRSSTATYIDSVDGLIKTAATNTPRFEKMADGGTGILLEGASTNICLYSERVVSIATNSVVTPAPINNVVDSPLGALTAWSIPDGATGFNQHNTAIPANTLSYTLSRYVTGTSGIVSLGQTGINAVDSIGQSQANLDLATMSVSGVSSARVNVTYVGLVGTAKWYRLSMTFVNSGTGTIFVSRETLTNTVGYASTGTQLEALPFASSYIPTTTAAVTRAADHLSISTSGNLLPINSAFTILADADYKGNAGTAFPLNSAQLFENTAVFRYFINSGNAHIAGTVAGGNNPAINTVARLGASSDLATVKTYLDGAVVGSATAVNTASASNLALSIGSDHNGNYPMYGHIRNFRIYNESLAAADIPFS